MGKAERSIHLIDNWELDNFESAGMERRKLKKNSTISLKLVYKFEPRMQGRMPAVYKEFQLTGKHTEPASTCRTLKKYEFEFRKC